MIRTIRDIKVRDKRVLLRTDYDVPLQNRKVVDDSRIRASLPTLKYLLKEKTKQIIILCHLDRPNGKIVESLRVKPVAEYLWKLLPKNASVQVEENLRFNPQEEENDQQFAQSLASRGDIYVNDAFAASHRDHASIVSLPNLLPSAIGLHFEEELKALKKVIYKPKRPLVLVVGGAKLETKLPLIEKFTNNADKILVGGKLASEIKKISSAKMLSRLTVAEVAANGKDITSQSAEAFAKIIKNARTVVWNGPMGIFEEKETSLGTKIIAQAVNESSGYTVIGGGDTEAAATKFKAENRIDHISMAGGAMLQYLAEGTLPGLDAIEKSKKYLAG